MEGFFVTNKGLEEITKAINQDSKVEIKKARFGSGASIGDEWDYDITSLKRSEYEKDLDPLTDTYIVNPDDPKSLRINVVVPVGEALTINEIGFFDRSDNLILYGIIRERVKEEVDEFEYRCWVKFDNTDESKVEIVIKSPEFERVEELVNTFTEEFEQSKTEFESKLDQKIEQTTQIVERAESDFDLSNYVSQDQFKQIEENANKVWHLDPENPTCQLSELQSKAESAKFGDMFVVSDDNNHAYVFMGSEVNGTVNGGWYDIGGHVDLSNYVTEGALSTVTDRVQKTEEKDSSLEKAQTALTTRVQNLENKMNTIEPMLTGLDTALAELIG